MSIQSEATLEAEFINRLAKSGYESVCIRDEKSMIDNLKLQLEKHNNTTFTDEEFDKIKNHLLSSSVFESAKKLRDKFLLNRDDKAIYVDFFNQEQWCKNLFQVTNQYSTMGKRLNRYDVTILINGFPLVQIELKKRGVELKKAFYQIDRYHRDSLRGLFNFVQIFIISNGVNTKYFSNNSKQHYSNTFNWTDEFNSKINNLDQFTDTFLEKCHLSKMIAKYTVIHESTNSLMVLRPYQYYATEKIIDLVENNPGKNGYVWHTTGSGKTLTSFKASQILATNNKIDKIVFVVDRKDLDYQTIKEFRSFSSDAVEDTANTASLKKQMLDPNVKLLVTTIQKLNHLISKDKYREQIQKIKDDRIVFIFDECHRSQFGEIHKKVNEFFTNKQFIGFTGTPIFRDNSINKQTTEDLFGTRLHSYVIKDAIDDENVLDFSVEYVETIHLKSEDGKEDCDIDELSKIHDIDRQEIFDSEERLNNIVDYILSIHNRKTYTRMYTALFAVSSVKNAIKYYDLFKKKNTDLKIATIFTYNPNEEATYSSDIAATDDNEGNDISYVASRDKLDEVVTDFNKNFGTNHDLNKANGFNAYYIDISKKVKEQQIDILIVVNMFLTGFDSKKLNTLYVDKSLKYHGLIQAFSRTNRTSDEKKNHGNIVCFRNLKARTDQAITLFSNEDAIATVLKKPYEYYKDLMNELLEKLYKISPTVQSVDQLEGSREEAFVLAFREVLRNLNLMETFSEFNFDDLDITAQSIEDYKSKYIDIHDKYKRAKHSEENESILDRISFELELIRRDHINVQYIIELVNDMEVNSASFAADKEHIYKLLDTTESLRSKKELIKKFIEENMIEANDVTDVEAELYIFMEKEKQKEIEDFADKENLSAQKINEIITFYEFTNRIERDRLRSLSNEKLKLLERNAKMNHWQTFVEETIEKYTW